MYSIYDYAYNGLLYLNNILRPRHKRLSTFINAVEGHKVNILSAIETTREIYQLIEKIKSQKQ